MAYHHQHFHCSEKQSKKCPRIEPVAHHVVSRSMELDSWNVEEHEGLFLFRRVGRDKEFYNIQIQPSEGYILATLDPAIGIGDLGPGLHEFGPMSKVYLKSANCFPTMTHNLRKSLQLLRQMWNYAIADLRRDFPNHEWKTCSISSVYLSPVSNGSD